MSHCHYRGELHTSAEIKGPFTEASNDFSEAFDILERVVFDALNADDKEAPRVGIFLEGNSMLLTIGGLTLSLERRGVVDISEGAA